jgi:diguanylate cyclase (GGDEF)-like protein
MVDLALKPEEYEYRRSALRILLIVTIFSASFFAVKNWLLGLHSLAIFEASAVVLWCFILSVVKTTSYLQRWSFVYLITFYFLVLYGMYFSSFKSGLFAWLFIFPIISYLLLGRKLGTILTFFSVFIGLGFLARVIWFIEPDINGIIMGNFGLCVLTIWSMVYVYESKSEAVIASLQEQVTKDPLTGLLNVGTLHDKLTAVLHSAKRRAEPVTIAYIDINDFKNINDTLGHQKGNEILLTVAMTIQDITRDEDHAFRYGGDEFCIIFSNCTEKQAKESYGKRLIAQTHQKLAQLGLSIGYSETGPREYLSADELIHQADQNMYAIKSANKLKHYSITTN